MTMSLPYPRDELPRAAALAVFSPTERAVLAHYRLLSLLGTPVGVLQKERLALEDRIVVHYVPPLRVGPRILTYECSRPFKVAAKPSGNVEFTNTIQKEEL